MTLGPYQLNSIVTGDARELAESIPDSSVDLIFTDPIYQNIEDYEWLARTAARVLKPDSSLLVWGGNQFVEAYILAIAGNGLKYKGNLTLFMGGPGGTPSGKDGNFVLKTTPCLWYTKGDCWPTEKVWNINIATTLTNLRGNHPWNKDPGTLRRWLAAFSESNAIILDPFTGGGTVPAVCKMLGRNYLAFEIEPATAEKARQRVELTQPPLFIMLRPEQVSLFAEVA